MARPTYTAKALERVFGSVTELLTNSEDSAKGIKEFRDEVNRSFDTVFDLLNEKDLEKVKEGEVKLDELTDRQAKYVLHRGKAEDLVEHANSVITKRNKELKRETRKFYSTNLFTRRLPTNIKAFYQKFLYGTPRRDTRYDLAYFRTRRVHSSEQSFDKQGRLEKPSPRTFGYTIANDGALTGNSAGISRIVEPSKDGKIHFKVLGKPQEYREEIGQAAQIGATVASTIGYNAIMGINNQLNGFSTLLEGQLNQLNANMQTLYNEISSNLSATVTIGNSLSGQVDELRQFISINETLNQRRIKFEDDVNRKVRSSYDGVIRDFLNHIKLENDLDYKLSDLSTKGAKKAYKAAKDSRSASEKIIDTYDFMRKNKYWIKNLLKLGLIGTASFLLIPPKAKEVISEIFNGGFDSLTSWWTDLKNTTPFKELNEKFIQPVTDWVKDFSTNMKITLQYPINWEWKDIISDIFTTKIIDPIQKWWNTKGESMITGWVKKYILPVGTVLNLDGRETFTVKEDTTLPELLSNGFQSVKNAVTDSIGNFAEKIFNPILDPLYWIMEKLNLFDTGELAKEFARYTDEQLKDMRADAGLDIVTRAAASRVLKERENNRKEARDDLRSLLNKDNRKILDSRVMAGENFNDVFRELYNQENGTNIQDVDLFSLITQLTDRYGLIKGREDFRVHETTGEVGLNNFQGGISTNLTDYINNAQNLDELMPYILYYANYDNNVSTDDLMNFLNSGIIQRISKFSDPDRLEKWLNLLSSYTGEPYDLYETIYKSNLDDSENKFSGYEGNLKADLIGARLAMVKHDSGQLRSLDINADLFGIKDNSLASLITLSSTPAVNEVIADNLNIPIEDIPQETRTLANYAQFMRPTEPGTVARNTEVRGLYRIQNLDQNLAAQMTNEQLQMLFDAVKGVGMTEDKLDEWIKLVFTGELAEDIVQQLLDTDFIKDNGPTFIDNSSHMYGQNTESFALDSLIASGG